MEVGFGPWHRLALVQTALPALDGVVAQLKAGARVADYGCGPGIALIEMAKAFPASEFHGYELSRKAIARAEANAAAKGVTNVAFHCVLDEALPADGSFSLVTTFDALHDMSRPEVEAARIRASLREDGCWFIADIKGMPTFAENLASNPLAALQYPMSVLLCLQSSMSSPDDVGYGSYGLPEPAMRELALAASFTRFRVVDLPSPFNAFYEARP
jgi:2-polyprenyl-3-methyl-5-hydroxy-6-metoxy-1,4-benzoquinol methylase